MKKRGEGVIQFIKFALVGVSNTAVDWAVFYAVTFWIISDKSFEPTAKAIAFAIAVLNSFLWNSIWTFRKEFKDSLGTKKERTKRGGLIFFRFVVVSLVGWVINVYIFKYTRFNLNQSKIIALILASAGATFWNFFANKFWTYKK